MFVFHPRHPSHALMTINHPLRPGDGAYGLVLDNNFQILRLSGTPVRGSHLQLDFNLARLSPRMARR